jgi:hypothetical protein
LIWYECLYFYGFIPNVVDNMSIDSEIFMVTSSKSRIVSPTLVLWRC